MRPGQGNGCFIADLHMGIADAVMRERWLAGDYDTPRGGKPRTEFVKGWRALAGRN